MMAEIYGKATGLCHGKGGSMHIADLDKGMLGANGIVGGGPPLVCGVGLSAKVAGTDQVGVSFFGDGGSNQGTFLESLNLAAVWTLPCVFVVENNGYAESTPVDASTSRASTSPSAPTASACPGSSSTATTSSPSTRRPARRSRRARAGGGPTLLECKVNRYYGHFEGDQQTYRAPGEVERAAPHARLPGRASPGA